MQKQTDEERFARIRQIARALRAKRKPTKKQWEEWVSGEDSAALITLLGSDRIGLEYVLRIAQHRFHSRFSSARNNMEVALSWCRSTPQGVLDELDLEDWAVCLGVAKHPNTSVSRLDIIAKLSARRRPADKLRAADERDQNREPRELAIARLARAGLWEPPAEE